jgi:hypothetical protein
VGGFIVAGHIRNGDVILAQPFEMAVFINHMQRVAKLPLLSAPISSAAPRCVLPRPLPSHI